MSLEEPWPFSLEKKGGELVSTTRPSEFDSKRWGELSNPVRADTHRFTRQYHGMRVPKTSTEGVAWTKEDYKEFIRRRAARATEAANAGDVAHAALLTDVPHFIGQVAELVDLTPDEEDAAVCSAMAAATAAFMEADDAAETDHHDDETIDGKISPSGGSRSHVVASDTLRINQKSWTDVALADSVALPADLLHRQETLLVRVVHPNAILPRRGSSSSAGLDLFAVEDGIITNDDVTNKINVGIQIALPKGMYGQIADRSGLALRGVKTVGGVVDADYRGDVSVMLRYHGDSDGRCLPFHYSAGQAIAQLIILPCSSASPTQVTALDSTTRGGRWLRQHRRSTRQAEQTTQHAGHCSPGSRAMGGHTFGPHCSAAALRRNFSPCDYRGH